MPTTGSFSTLDDRGVVRNPPQPGSPRTQRPGTPAPFCTPLAGSTAPVPVTVDPAAVTPNDTRIMLHMLLSEARAYHEARAASLRRPTTPARFAPEMTSPQYENFLGRQRVGSPLDMHWRPTPNQSPDGALQSFVLDRAASTTTLPVTSDADSTLDRGVRDSLPTLAEDGRACDNAIEYDGWADLQSQIEALWYEPVDEPPAQRYLRLKTYLTWLFIWDAGRDWDDFGEVSAAASAEWIQTRQKARIDALPPGRLFAEN